MSAFRQFPRRVIRALVLCCAWPLVSGCGHRDSVQSPSGEGVADSAAISVVPLPPGSGLDARPHNTTCVATKQPLMGLAVSAARTFPNLFFDAPVQLLQAPGDASRWFVLEHGGRIKVIPSGTPATAVAGIFADLTDPGSGASSADLLAMAFDPSYATNGRVYLSYVARPPAGSAAAEARIARFNVSHGTVDRHTEAILLRLPINAPSRAVGAIAFGPDKMLYAAFGDDDARAAPQGNAQRLDTLDGKLIRIDVRGADAYAIPADNPYAGAGVRCPTGSAGGGLQCAEIYASGFHSPRAWSFDPASAQVQIWLADSGQDRWEEVDRVARGGNYGWPLREGTHCADDRPKCADPAPAVVLTGPVAEYPHRLGNSVTGGLVYHGSAIPWLKDRYVFGDFTSGSIFALRQQPDGSLQVEEILRTGAKLSSFAEGPDHELYYVNYSGTVHELTPGTMKLALSRTGCVNPSDPTQPAPGLIPYEVVAPFWSDGAVKTRWMALPEGARIKVEASGHFTFPPGTVLMKNFVLQGQLIETRLLMRHIDTGNWGGYTYRWNAAHTDATLDADGEEVVIGNQTWSYLNVGNCLRCHTTNAGGSLGPETRQLNSSIVYPATGRKANQLSTLISIGMFSNRSPAQPPYPDPHDTSRTIEERARAYLQTNCSQCHRPGSGIPADLDFRFATPMSATKLCNVAPPIDGSLGIPGERLIVPGDTGRSLLYQRVSRRGRFQMPPLATHVVDAQGVALLKHWIEGMKRDCRW